GASSVYGTEVHLSFDPAIVEVTSVTHGDFLSPDPDNEAFVLENDADNIEGTVDYALSLLNPAPPAEGNGLLLQVTFQAKSEGETSIELVNSLFGTQTGEEILPAVDGPIDLVVGNAVAPQAESAGADAPAQLIELQSTDNGPTRVNNTASDNSAVTLLGLSLVAGAILIAGLGLLAVAVMIGLWLWLSKSKRKKRVPQAVSS
ncbi:MAG: cohesin domain-containing protein, partial [Anaerolineae bacterium]|nr:cohesin domain-containing protein [Anaerolineae bacterium]